MTEWLQGLVSILTNPSRRLTFIHLIGAKEIDANCGTHSSCESPRHPVLWGCDPMHGNTETAQGGLKTRRFENIVTELEAAFRIHREQGTYLGGVHFELTGDDVTECTGGARGLTDVDLQRAYKSTVDPRLNYEQALELAMKISGLAKLNVGAQHAAPVLPTMERVQHAGPLQPSEARRTGRQPINVPFTHRPSNQSQCRKSDRRRHAAHLSITPFINSQLEPTRRDIFAEANGWVARPKPVRFFNGFGLCG